MSVVYLHYPCSRDNWFNITKDALTIITEDDLISWYEKALRGKYSEQMGSKLIGTLIEEIAEEFPSVDTQKTYFHHDTMKESMMTFGNNYLV